MYIDPICLNKAKRMVHGPQSKIPLLDRLYKFASKLLLSHVTILAGVVLYPDGLPHRRKFFEPASYGKLI